MYTFYQYLILELFVLIARLNSTDGWIRSAIEVFDFMKNGHKTTFDYSVGVNANDYKLALYK